MKKSLILLCICFVLINQINAETNQGFIVVDNGIEIDEQVYSFFSDFFSKHSKNLLENGSRMILNEEKRVDLNNYYDRQGYFDSYFLYDKDNFYVVETIVFNNKKQKSLEDFYINLGILYEEYYDVTYKVKAVYDQYGKKVTDNTIKEFSDHIGVFRYSGRCRLSMLGSTTSFNWVLAVDEDTLVEKLKKGELKIDFKETPNHYIERKN